MSTPAVKLVRNTIANGVGTGAAIVTGLAITPVLVNRLGLDGYGVWAIALGLTFGGGYAALSELGAEGAAVRYVAEASAEGDLDGLNLTVSSGFALFCAIAAVLVPLGVALAHLLVPLLGVPDRLAGSATLCFEIVAAQLVFELPSRALVAALEGTQRFVLSQSVEVARVLALGLLSLLVVLEGWGVVGLGVALAATSLAAFFTLWLLCHVAIDGLRVNPLRASRAEISRLMRYGGGVFSLRVLTTMYNQIDKAIIGIALGTRAIGLYEIANKINLSAEAIAKVSATAVVPAAASLRDDREVLRDMYVRGSCYALAATLPFAVAAFVFAKPLLLSWIGPRAAPAIGAAQLFVIYAALQMVHNVGAMMLYGLGRIRLPLIVNSAAMALNIGLSIVLVHPLGFTGVVVATLIANGVAWPLLLAYYLRVFDTPLRVWLARLIAPNLPGLVLQVAISLPLYVAIGEHTRSLIVSLLLVGSSIAVSLAGFATLGLHGEDRRVLIQTIRDALRLSPQRAVA